MPARRSLGAGGRLDDPAAYHAEGVLYLAPHARFDHLLALPEGGDVGKAVNEAMRDIEKQNPHLAGVLPKTFNLFTSTLLKELLKKVSEIPATADYDAFGRIYEYFLGEFARTERGTRNPQRRRTGVGGDDCPQRHGNIGSMITCRLKRAKGAKTRQPRATPWELGHPNIPQP